MSNEPKTTAALMDCPIMEFMTFDTIVLDTPELVTKYGGWKLGDTIRIPRMAKVSITPRSPDSIMVAFDKDGTAWQPELKDGVWYKKEAAFW